MIRGSAQQPAKVREDRAPRLAAPGPDRLAAGRR
jgi:hypothetical protein